MKRLYVGCRVRVLDDPMGNPKVAGREGVIVEMDIRTFERDRKTRTVGAKVDMGGMLFCRAPYWVLSPIQDPGHQVISWADMEGLWQPKGVEA